MTERKDKYVIFSALCLLGIPCPVNGSPLNLLLTQHPVFAKEGIYGKRKCVEGHM
jgi:hypothetical protein